MNPLIRELTPDEFPKRLLEIPDKPKKLFIRGQMPPEDYKWLAVVGSRKYTPYGRQVCEKLIAGLHGQPVVIVSGLALGIDALAHETALDNGLTCVAVPGSGLDPKVIYPASNYQLAERIIDKGGALLSEFEPDFQATTWSFPQRNRIMAGLSDAILVIEAEIKSGTLITSRLATDYNREVMTVPGSIFSSTSEGPHMLIRLGATPITTSKDILDALGLVSDSPLAVEDRYKDISMEEMAIIKLLAIPTSRDELIRKSGMSVSRANSLLSVMEIKGLIKESLGEIRLS
ncbi:MAG: DNA-processing protein DprA [Candidatus Paceibacterota bacterium]|jgi:DNA processing protein